MAASIRIVFALALTQILLPRDHGHFNNAQIKNQQLPCSIKLIQASIYFCSFLKIFTQICSQVKFENPWMSPILFMHRKCQKCRYL